MVLAKGTLNWKLFRPKLHFRNNLKSDNPIFYANYKKGSPCSGGLYKQSTNRLCPISHADLSRVGSNGNPLCR